jgi:FlaA1/EpsC-like NDP-sugar epimerase
MTRRMIRRLASSFSKRRAISTDAIHLFVSALAFVSAFALRLEFALSPEYRKMLLVWLAPVLMAKWFASRISGIHNLAWRYFGLADVWRIVTANVAGSLLVALVVQGNASVAFPRSIILLDLLLSMGFIAAAHATMRALYERSAQNASPERPRKRIVIYGAGQAGVTLLSEIRAHPELRMVPVGFIDDDPHKKNLRLHGLRVLGGGKDLVFLVTRSRIDQVLLAIPAATGSQLAGVLERCQAARVETRKIPPLAELIESKVLVDQIRDVRLEDLLGRPPVTLDESALRDCLEGRAVLVTGAGGSIGSELCRQIARFHPAALIGFDQSETALYEIDREMRERFPHLKFVAAIGSIRNRKRLDEVFLAHQPAVIYHAAAYKHVPMMEAHPFEAVENNVFGTRNLVSAAVDHSVGTFVLVSSDKAVRPTNVMGATKRIAEMICLAESRAGSVAQSAKDSVRSVPIHTRFMAVRFGNVLGSNGSVIPLFRRQIAAGGPVTVTHPEMRRYFMTIPEAAQLVLQASSLGSGGEIFVLEMGEPVAITELARKLVLLSGLEPGKDIRIEYSGVRPGEKLNEELSLQEEQTSPTAHRQIRILSGPPIASEHLNWDLERLRVAVEERDAARIVLCLRNTVPEYSPSTNLLERAFSERVQRVAVAAI